MVAAPVGGIGGYEHRPWANTFRCYPDRFFQPETVEQVQAIVRYAAANDINIVLTGATHSPSLITYTRGWLMNLDKLDRILDIQGGQGDYSDVTVEAGIRLEALNEALPKRGLALQNLGSISEQSVAGVISTGTHGASYCHGLISEQFVSITLVTESGDLVTVSDEENPDLFRAVLIGLGAFGIIVKATIRCVPAFNIESKSYILDFETLLSPSIWDKVFLESEFHRIWWYPYADKFVVWQGDRTTKPAKPVAAKSFSGSFFGRLLYEFLLWISVRWIPGFTPVLERWYFKRQFNEGAVVKHVDRSDRQINMDCLFKQFVNEWSLPLSNGPEILRELKQEILKENFYVHSPFELRASNTTLPSRKQLSNLPPHRSPHKGPVYGNVSRPILDPSPVLPYATPDKTTNAQLTLNLNATLFRPFRYDPQVDVWYDYFESISAKYNGRPHWAKNFRSNPWLEPQNRGLVKEWKSLRDSISPKHIFGSQEWLKEKGLD